MSSSTDLNLQIRQAAPADLCAINEIYNYYVARSTATFAMQEESLADRIKWFEEHSTKNLAILACFVDGQVIAWGSLSPYSGRCAYKSTVELSVYIHHQYTGRGIGRKILDELIAEAQKRRFHALLGLVCSENDASIALFARCGFEQVGLLKQVGHKFDRWLDVSIWQRNLEVN
jgi:phosphinothricin acetyltransferase